MLLGERVVGLRKLARGLAPTRGAAPTADYFERCIRLEPQLRAAVAGLTTSRDTVRRQRLLLERDIAALLTGRREIDDVAAEIEAMSQSAVTRARRHELAVQVVVIDQAVAGLQLGAVAARRLTDAVDAVLLETTLALRTLAISARKLLRQRVIVDRIRAETLALEALAGAAPGAPAGRTVSGLAGDESWQSLALAWHRVERAASVVETLRGEIAS